MYDLAIRLHEDRRREFRRVLAVSGVLHLAFCGLLARSPAIPVVNLSAAEGHPASVMDMSFATQALATEYAKKQNGKLSAKVHDVPKSIDAWVARLKLKSMGIKIDKLTPEQKKYLSSSGEGT